MQGSDMPDSAFTSSIDPPSAVATVALARPDHGNVLSAAEIRELGLAIKAAGNRTDVKAVVIRSEGDAFCLGREPGPAPAAKPSALSIRTNLADPILGLYADVRATEVPVIAIVHGEARGFGAALVGQCDLAIAAETATFSFPEMDSNLPPTLAMSAVLGKVPPKHILHLVLTRARIPAAQAHAIGLLSEVHPQADLADAARRTISRLTDRSRPALCAVKEYLLTAQHLDPAAAARLAANTIATVVSSQD